jgi:uncharacterized protein YecT (DUF1311 family)
VSSYQWQALLCASVWMGSLAIGYASEPAAASKRWPAYPAPTKEAEVSAWSRTIKLRPAFSTCLDRAAGATAETRACLGEEHAYQDARLNRVYHQLISGLNENARQALRVEERSWIAFRDEHCALPKDPGEQDELDHLECLVDQTADRATELEAQFARK